MGSQEVTDTAFGLFIAYLIPGLVALYGLPLALPGAPGWAATVGPDATASYGLFVLLQATAVGLAVSAVRWLVVDSLHHRTGVRPPAWDFAALDRGAAGFELLIHIHYRYYKFYANTVVALVWAYAAGGYATGWFGAAAYGPLAGLFFLASRDALGKYYDRVGRLLGPAA